jgi:hypothetical protein
MAPASSSPKPSKKLSNKTATRPRGRPRKDGEVADRLLSVRLVPADWALLEALVEQQRAAMREAGAMTEAAERVGAADVVRGLVRQAARASGLAPR